MTAGYFDEWMDGTTRDVSARQDNDMQEDRLLLAQGG